MIKLIHSDFRKRIHEFAPYDCFITSPPYNIGKKYDTHDDTLAQYDYVRLIVEMFQHAKEHLVDNGHLFLNVGNTCKQQYIVNNILNLGKDYLHLQNTIIWVKSVFIDKTYGHFKPITSDYYINNNFEYVLHYTKKPTKIQRYNIGVPMVDQRNIERFSGRTLTCRGNVWFIPYDTTNAYKPKPNHPAPYPEKLVEMCLKLIGLPRTSKVCDPFLGCYDKDTEILTTKGWKFFKDLIGDEDFYSLNPSGEIEITKSIKYHEYDYSGDMISILGRSVDLFVTPNHNLYVKEVKQKNYKFIKAEDMKWTHFHFCGNGIWNAGNQLYDHDFLRLIGFFIGDGYCNNHRVGFRFQKPRKIAYLLKLLKNLNIQFKSYKEGNTIKFYINRTHLPSIFPFGNAHTKRIPSFIYELDPASIDAFISGYFEADGYQSSITSCNYDLLSDVQHLLLLCGKSGGITWRFRSGSNIGSRILNPSVEYRLSIYKNGTRKFLHNRNYSIVPNWKGKVYCITLEKNNVLYVRRNGHAVWCGNSGTTAVVCKKMGFDCYGFDISLEYLKEAKERCLSISLK